MATSSKAKKKTVRIASGRKRARQDVKLNAANTALRSKFRTVIKNVQKAVTAGDKAKATEKAKAIIAGGVYRVQASLDGSVWSDVAGNRTASGADDSVEMTASGQVVLYRVLRTR